MDRMRRVFFPELLKVFFVAEGWSSRVARQEKSESGLIEILDKCPKSSLRRGALRFDVHNFLHRSNFPNLAV